MNFIKDAGNFLFAVIPPVHRPNASNAPTQTLKHIDLRKFTVSCRLGRFISAAIEKDAEQILLRIGRINNSDIDLIGGLAD